MGVPHAAISQERGLKMALVCISDWKDGSSNLGNGIRTASMFMHFPPEGEVMSFGGAVSDGWKKRDRRSVEDMEDGLVGVGICEARDLRESNHRCCFVGGLLELELTVGFTAEAGRWLFVVASKASRPLMLPLMDLTASRERRPSDWCAEDAWQVVGMLLVDLGVTFSPLGRAVHPVLPDGGVTGSDNMLMQKPETKSKRQGCISTCVALEYWTPNEAACKEEICYDVVML